MRKLLVALQAGVLAGSLVGILEALYVLTAAGSISDYVALFYGAVLYALIGAGMGVFVGIGVLIISKVWKGMSDPIAWTVGFYGVFGPLGLVIGRYIANKAIYAEAGVPMSGLAAIAGFLLVDFLVCLWLFPILMTKTPLKILMEPRGTLAAFGLILVGTGLFSFVPGGGEEGIPSPDRDQAAIADKDNVILIMVDTLRADYLGAYSDEFKGKTPNIEGLATDGVVFERARANASWTRASFANIYTSMVPSSHNTDLKSSFLPDDVQTLAEVLSKHGYVTGGLPNNTNVTQTFNFHQGFDHYPYMAPEMPFWGTESVYQLSMYSVLRKVAEKMKGDHKEVTDFYQPADTVIGHGKAYIEAQGDKKWFLMMHFMEPHDPYFERPYNGVGYGRAEHEVPEADKVEYLKQTYATEIQYMDTDIGVFLDWLKETGRYDNTTIILSADHGEEFLEHDGWWHGTTLYEEQIHVPLIIKLGDSQYAGTRAPWNVRHVDIAPTIAGLAGAAPGADWQGKTVLDADFQAYLPKPAPEPVEGEEAAPAPIQPDGRSFDRLVLAEEDFEGNQITAIINGDWKFIQANEGNPRGLATEELYDLHFDAAEAKNVTDSNPGTADEMRGVAQDALNFATGKAVAGVEGEMDEATKARLQALGYMD